MVCTPEIAGAPLFMNPSRIIPIQNSDQFEDFCCEIARDWFGDFAAQRYGRSGQTQGGIDINATSREISACNIRGDSEKVVIQCKYRKDPKNCRSSKVIQELEKDLKSALAAHRFDVFIYACTLERRTELKGGADRLSLAYNKEVQIWFWDDLEQAVHIHPRLQRMYAEDCISSGVQLLDPDFLDGLASKQADAFQFFTGKVTGDWQWLGVYHGLAAERTCRPEIDRILETLFEKPFLDTRIAALVYGEGGSGKSVLLRQIAIDHARHGVTSWWVENLEAFINHDAKSISLNSHLRHLVFVEDWYRNMKDTSGAKFFNWLTKQHNVLVIIGDRSFQSSIYGDYCYHGTEYQLLPSENRAILEHIATASVDYSSILEELGALHSLVDHASLFMILFVAATLLIDREEHVDIDLNDGVITAFQKIIGKNILALEKDVKYRGLGKSLNLLANIYASDTPAYTLFEEDFFLKTAVYFGNNEELPKRMEMENYPPEVTALVYKKTRVSKSMEISHFIAFNHDVLAEKGVVQAHSHNRELATLLKLDNYYLVDLLKTLMVDASPNGVLALWIWLYTERKLVIDEAAIAQLLQFLEKSISNVYAPFLRVVLRTIASRSIRENICQSLLEQSGFLSENSVRTVKIVIEEAGSKAAENVLSQDHFINTLSPQVVCTLLYRAGKRAAAVAAEKILSRDNLSNTLSPVLFCTALRKSSKPAASTAAEVILSHDNFLGTFSPRIVKAALNTASVEAAKTAATIVLSQDIFSGTVAPGILSAALRKADCATAKIAAHKILSEENFFSTFSSVAIRAALKFADEPAATTAAEKILSRRNFFNTLPPGMVNTALEAADKAVSAVAAEKILAQKDFFNTLDPGIVCIALNTANKASAATAAKSVLSQDGFFKIFPHALVNAALKNTDRTTAEKAARIILSQLDFAKASSESLACIALNNADGRAAATAMTIILSQDDFLRTTPHSIIVTALKRAGATGAAFQAARTVLKHSSEANTFLVFAAIKTLLLSDKPEDSELNHQVVDKLNRHLGSGDNNSSRLYDDLLYLPLFDNPTHRERVLRCIKDYGPKESRQVKYNVFKILKCFSENPETACFKVEVESLSRGILHDCVEDIKYQLQSGTRAPLLAHIGLAIQHPALVAQAAKTSAELVAYGQQHVDFQASALYKQLLGQPSSLDLP
ncbi:MAG: hypothetical protein ACI92E_000912 [Oceanicoccus sp.]|jgi:hypothetical protein